MKYLLDTDHTSILDRPRGAEYAVLTVNLNLHSADGVGVSVVTFQEHVLGANARISSAKTEEELLRGYELLGIVLENCRSFPLVAFDAASLLAFGRMRALKIRIATLDLRIASIALANDLTLVTRNRGDFEKVPGLRIEDWTK